MPFGTAVFAFDQVRSDQVSCQPTENHNFRHSPKWFKMLICMNVGCHLPVAVASQDNS